MLICYCKIVKNLFWHLKAVIKWMKANMLKLTESKQAEDIIGRKIFSLFEVDGVKVLLLTQVKSLVVLLGCALFEKHIAVVAKNAFLSTFGMETAMFPRHGRPCHADLCISVRSSHGYCNLHYMGLPLKTIQRSFSSTKHGFLVYNWD